MANPSGKPLQRDLDRAAAEVALSAALECARQSGSTQFVVVLDSRRRMLAQSAETGTDHPCPELIGRAQRIADLCIETDGLGNDISPELPFASQFTGPCAPSGLAIRDRGTLVGAIAVVSEGDADNRRVAEAGMNAVFSLLENDPSDEPGQ